MNPSPDAVAMLVDEACKGDEQALATLLSLVYDELRRLGCADPDPQTDYKFECTS